MPRRTLAKLVAAILALTAVTSVVMLIPRWNGVPGSKEAKPIDTLLEVMIVLSSFVFAIVMVMLVYSIWRYRAKPGDESDGAPVHGNTALEILWTLIPTVIVLTGATYSWIVLDDIEARDQDKMVIEVTAQQFTWTFHYPQEDVTTNQLHVPVGRQIEFQLHAADVLHSFWVPEWRIKKDAVPGSVTRAVLTPDKEDHLTLLCAELCGLGHSTMRAPVVAESEQRFDKWLAREKARQGVAPGAPGAPPGREPEGMRVFTSTGCGACHTLESAGTEADLGPNLDRNLRNKDEKYIETAIVDPDNSVAPGFASDVMPEDYSERLDRKELSALVRYLYESTRGK
jgi:cytochrome c oxidase subunit II